MDKNSPDSKAMASLAMLVSWTIWNERNARVFRRRSAPATVLLGIVVDESRLWITAGAKHLGVLLSRE